MSIDISVHCSDVALFVSYFSMFLINSSNLKAQIVIVILLYLQSFSH